MKESSGKSDAPAFSLITVAASAGGLNALSKVLGGLAEDFPIPLLVVQHLDPRHKSLMAEILNRRTGLKVKEAENSEKILPGWVYVAPSNHHMLVADGGVLSLTQSELVNFVRPSANLMFSSAAACYKDKLIAVVLSGSASDGTIGLAAVKQTGGHHHCPGPRNIGPFWHAGVCDQIRQRGFHPPAG